MEKKARFNLGPIKHIPMGQGQSFTVKGGEVSIFRLRSGDIAAIESRCPHQSGPLAEGMTADGVVLCPLHGHKFDLKTGVGSEDGECVKVFPVSIENGDIVLEYVFQD